MKKNLIKSLPLLTTSVATAISVLLIGSIPAFGQAITIVPQALSEPIVLQGNSGGGQTSSNCGNIAAAPNHMVQLNADFPYLRFSLQGSGQPTLLIRLPNGTTSCISADSTTGRINAPGYWEQGSYEIYVGDRTGQRHPYTLSVTQRRN